MVTPFTAEGAVDEAGARRLARHIVKGGSQGIMVAGTTGEAASMIAEDRIRLVRWVVDEVGRDALIFGGIGDNSLRQSAALGAAYLEAGAAAVVAHPPSYYAVGPEELEGYFSALADRIDGPLYLYNIPQTTRHSLPLPAIERLSHHPRIVGIKDSEPDAGRQAALPKLFAGREDFAVFCGAVPFTGPAMAAGADGFIPSGGNLAPALCRKLMDCWVAGDTVAAEAAQKELGQVGAVYQEGRTLGRSLAALKAALSASGICGPHMLPPLTACNATEAAEIRRRVALLGLPVSAG